MSDLDFDALNMGQGWINDPVAVRAVIESEGIKALSEHIGPQAGERPIKTDLSVYLKKLWGDQWYLNQSTCGSCVSFGYALAVDVLVAIQIVDGGMEKPEGRTATEPIYWGSRVEIGGNSLWGEGSVGAWAAKWLKNYGVAVRKKYGSYDLTTYSASVCCSRQSRQGVPQDIEDAAKTHPVKSYAQVSTFDELAKSIESGYPVPVCSNQGFTKARDAQGFASPHGSWGHCMCAIGVRHDRPGVLIANSWGAYYNGGPADMSPATKWVDAKVWDRMASQGDTFAISDLTGWERKGLSFARLNW